MDYKEIIDMFDDPEDIPNDIVDMIMSNVGIPDTRKLTQEMLYVTQLNGGTYMSNGSVEFNGQVYKFNIMSAMVPESEYVRRNRDD